MEKRKYEIIQNDKEKKARITIGIELDLDEYEIKEDKETDAILFVKKGIKGEPDFAIEGDGVVVEFKDNKIYVVDILE